MFPELGQCILVESSEKNGAYIRSNALPNHDYILAIRGARSSSLMDMCGKVSTGKPGQYGVMRGLLFALLRPISSTEAAAYPS